MVVFIPTLSFVASTTNVSVSTVSAPPVIVPDAVRVVLLMVEGNLALAIVPVNADESRSVSEAPEPLNVPPVIVPDAVRVVLLMVEGSLALSIVPVNWGDFRLVSPAAEPVNDVAVTVPLTSSAVLGLVLPIPTLLFVASTTNVLVSMVSDPPVIAPDAVRVVLLMVEGNLALASVPELMLSASKFVRLLPSNEPTKFDAVTVPVTEISFGNLLVFSVPEVMLPASKSVRLLPSNEPTKLVAVTVPLTSSFVLGLVVPMPTLPFVWFITSLVVTVACTLAAGSAVLLGAVAI